MGCSGSSQNTKHGSAMKRRESSASPDPATGGDLGKDKKKKTKGSASPAAAAGPKGAPPGGDGGDDCYTGIVPPEEQKSGGDVGPADESAAPNPFARWGNSEETEEGASSQRALLSPLDLSNRGDQLSFRRSSNDNRPVSPFDRASSPDANASSRRTSRRGSVNPGGRPRPSVTALDASLTLGVGSPGLGGGGSLASPMEGSGRRRSHGTLSPMPSADRRSSASLIGNVNVMPLRSPAGQRRRSSVGAPRAMKTDLPFHPRSRVLPRQQDSRFDSHYRGIYKNPNHPSWKILSPRRRAEAQDQELNRTQISEGVFGSPANGTGLVWPVIGTNWRHLKFSSQDQHVGDNSEKTGDEYDDDLAPLCALTDVAPTDADSQYLTGLRLKKTAQHVTEMMAKIESMVQSHGDVIIVSMGPVSHDLAVSCCRVGLMRLTSVFVALTALVGDYQLLINSKAGFLRALHAGSARHFEEDFTRDLDQPLPSHPVSGEPLVSTFKDGDEASVVDDDEILSAFVEYLKGRFKSDIQYCVAVARALVDEGVDTRELDAQGFSKRDKDAPGDNDDDDGEGPEEQEPEPISIAVPF